MEKTARFLVTNSFSLVRLRSVLSVVNQFELSIRFSENPIVSLAQQSRKKWVGAEVVVVMNRMII